MRESVLCLFWRIILKEVKFEISKLEEKYNSIQRIETILKGKDVLIYNSERS